MLYFYRCMICGNFVLFLNDKSSSTPICCGQEMSLLTPNSIDAAFEKHVPVMKENIGHVEIRVGSVPHPMTLEHHICWVILETDHGWYKKDLCVGDCPCVDFRIAGHENAGSAYVYCNLHGLWEVPSASRRMKKQKEAGADQGSNRSATRGTGAERQTTSTERPTSSQRMYTNGKDYVRHMNADDKIPKSSNEAKSQTQQGTMPKSTDKVPRSPDKTFGKSKAEAEGVYHVYHSEDDFILIHESMFADHITDRDNNFGNRVSESMHAESSETGENTAPSHHRPAGMGVIYTEQMRFDAGEPDESQFRPDGVVFRNMRPITMNGNMNSGSSDYGDTRLNEYGLPPGN